MNLDVTPLPGIGSRTDFLTRSGRRIGVVTHRDGRFDLLLFRADDPDACSESIPLTAEEASTLANLMGAPQLVAQLASEQQEMPGIETSQLMVTPGSPYDGRTLGDAALRSRTGVSVVAVVRAGQVHASPRPDFQFLGGDVVVAVGTMRGLSSAVEILERG